MFRNWLQDARYAFHSLRRSTGFTAAAVISRRANVRGRRLLVAAAPVACPVPARRAAAADPVEVLRDE